MITIKDGSIKMEGSRIEIALELAELYKSIAIDEPDMFVAVQNVNLPYAEEALKKCEAKVAIPVSKILERIMKD